MPQRELIDRAQRAVLDSSPLAVIASDAEGRVVVWNPAAERLFGWPAEEALGRGVLDLGLVPSGEEAGQFEAQRRLALSGGGSGEALEATRLRRDGSAFTARIWPAPLRDADGGLAGFLGFVTDVSEERRREEARRADEERFRAVFTHSHDAILVFDPERDALLDASPSACDMLGYRREELLRQRPSSIHAHEPAAFARFVERVRADGAARTDQLTCRGRDGGRVPCEIAASWVGLGGRPWVMAIIRDVRDRRAMEARLREAEQRYRDLYERAPFAYLSVGVDGRVRLANRAAADLLGRADLIGSAVLDLYDPDRPEGRPRARALLERFRAGEEIRGEELAMRAADGRTVWVALSVSPVTDAAGEVVASRSIAEDITARKLAEEELAASLADLERVNGELEQLALGVAHDLAAPLRTVTAYTRLLRARSPERLDADAAELAGFVEDGAAQLRRLSEGLLGYAQAGQAREEPGEVDLGVLVERTLRALAAEVADAGARVEVGALPTVWGEERGLGMVVQNLIGNAVRYHVPGEPPVVAVSAHREGEAWRVEVADEGVGIDPSARELVFGMFTRGGPGVGAHGAGIGLAVCRRVVERHGGRIWVGSGRQRGSVLCFTVPDRPRPR